MLIKARCGCCKKSDRLKRLYYRDEGKGADAYWNKLNFLYCLRCKVITEECKVVEL